MQSTFIPEILSMPELLNELALFAGAGGGVLASTLLGWRTVCAVELDPYCASVLAQRQNDRFLPTFPIWDDVRTFDGKPWNGLIDVVSGGFPCQDISIANVTATGISGSRSGLWQQLARIIGEVRPYFVFVENSPILTSRGLGRVLGDLAKMGYNARWGVFSACTFGASHTRARLFLLAYSSRIRYKRCRETCLSSTKRPSNNRPQIRSLRCQAHRYSWWNSEPNLDRVANGLAARLDRVKALGNGQVPVCAAMAFQTLSFGLI